MSAILSDPSGDAHDEDDARAEHLQILEPSSGWLGLQLREVWEFRELLWFLGWRDVKVRYKQTALGASWAILQPVLTMIVFSVFFGNLAGVPSDGVPYPLFSFTALLPWTLFSNSMAQASNSLVGSANLLKKVYFPRLILPMSSTLSGLVDFLLASLVLILLMFHYDVVPTWRIVFVPAFVLLALITALGVGTLLSALNVHYRDVRYVIPFVVQLWLLITPIAYASSLLEEPWRTIYAINPMAGVVEGMRWSLLGVETAPGPMVLVSTIVALLIMVVGVVYFRRMERTFADVV